MNADWLFALSPLVIALAAVGVIVPVYVRLGRLEGEVTSNRERSNEQFREARERADAQHAETLAEIRRLTDAFLSHSHAPDGGIIFRVPPPSGSTLPE